MDENHGSTPWFFVWGRRKEGIIVRVIIDDAEME